jgi:hypothetical protein
VRFFCASILNRQVRKRHFACEISAERIPSQKGRSSPSESPSKGVISLAKSKKNPKTRINSSQFDDELVFSVGNQVNSPLRAMAGGCGGKE